jgi:hypothetical protein
MDAMTVHHPELKQTKRQKPRRDCAYILPDNLELVVI